MPFWFWNDRLEKSELRRQLRDFKAHGVSGVVIHPRIGLPRDLAWMSDSLLRFYEYVVEDAARLGMKVILYDEGMYPSGSSCGQVVRSNPRFQCRGLSLMAVDRCGTPDLPEGYTWVATVARRGGRRVAVVDRPIRSEIRGVHYHGEGPAEDNPPAADILNPQAVQRFIELVYDGFAARLARHFGSTILGIFTDEPSFLGRCLEQGVRPGTTGILAEVNRLLGYDFTPHLPALWFDDEPEAQHYRAEWHRGLLARLTETYYTPLSRWCRAHGLALMGHPEGPDHLGALHYFDIPGQDLVWRWVLPDQASALEGPQSTQAKCSASAMLHGGRRQNLNEYSGAYGHELTWEEMNWLSNWCLVRGVNLLVPHAFYYSIRGVRRDERPPDVGPHSPWWDRYHDYAAACRRLCWINTDSVPQCSLAILGDDYELPWCAAKVCFEGQYDFNYLSETELLSLARLTPDGIRVRDLCYSHLVVEGGARRGAVGEVLRVLSGQGRILRMGDGPEAEEELRHELRRHGRPVVRTGIRTPALRVRHVLKEGRHYFLLFNERAAEFRRLVHLPVPGPAWELDPETGACARIDRGQPLHFRAHQLRVLVVGKGSPARGRRGDQRRSNAALVIAK